MAEQQQIQSVFPTIYTSPLPDIHIPKHSVFEHIFPIIGDVYPRNEPALIDGISGETLSRESVHKHALTLAAAMIYNLNLRQGEVVMILSPNSIQYPIVLLAAVAAGLKVTFANPAYTAGELAHQIEDSNTACVFTHSDALTTLRAALPRSFDTKNRVILMPHAMDIPPAIMKEGWLILDDLLNGTQQLEPVRVEGAAAVDSTVFLYYSSGTTGKSKGVESTHHNMVSAFEMTTANWNAVENGRDVMLAVIPWYHITGGCVTMLYALHAAVPIVVLPRFEPKAFLGAIERFHATAMVVAPPILMFFQNSPLVEEYNLASLRTILCGSAPASKALIQNATNRLLAHGATSITIGQAFGLTETSPGTHVTPPEWARRKAGKVGRLQPNMQARLVDDDEQDVPRGSRGELWVRGPNVMKGYLNRPEATKETITPDGWLKTGDIATIDEDGFAQIVDRKKELIKYKGFQVPPAELEALLLQNADISDAGVIGVFSLVQETELPRAYVVPKDLTLLRENQKTQALFTESVQHWVKQRVVHYKALRGGVILVEQIPRSAAGKILRKELRALATAPGATALITDVKAKL